MGEPHDPDLLSRRRFLARAAGGALCALTAGGLWSPVAWAQGTSEAAGQATGSTGPRIAGRAEGLVTRVSRPQDLETPVHQFTSWLTPNHLFFVRSHFGPPDADRPQRWQLQVSGEVDRPLTLTLSDLQHFDEVTMPAVVQCSGNGRAFFRPSVPGAQWEKGAVGNARWTGVRLADVLQRAGLSPKAKHVQMLGADRPLFPTTPLFLRSIPIEKALHPATLLAYQMNGEPLPLLHGAPLRLIVPGWAGDVWTKWLTQLTVQEREAEGYYMQTAYRLPATPVQPGETLISPETIPVTEMVVKSLIAQPSDGAIVTGGEIVIQGIAFTGEGHVVRVEISTDEGASWQRTELMGEPLPYTWRLWRYPWKETRPGRYTVLSRATDSLGRSQPLVTPWNPGGFLWNSVDRLRIQVQA